MAKTLFFFVLCVHGLIHLMGFLKAFDLAAIEQLNQEISRTAGLLWLIAALLFLITAVQYGFGFYSWWIVGAAAIFISQVLIIWVWSDAKFGTIANLIIAVPVFLAFLAQRPSAYLNLFEFEVQQRLGQQNEQQLLTEKDLAPLPELVQRYVRYSGAVGKPKVQNFRVQFSGFFKKDPNSEFRPIRALQYSFPDEPVRLYYMDMQMFGLPIAGLHRYIGEEASMQIRMAHTFELANARGQELSRSETVTLLNDLCFLAPAALIDKCISWEPVDNRTVRASLTNGDYTISGTLVFNEEAQLVNFFSDDRSESVDGQSYNRYRWSTPLSNYKNFDGRKVASHGEAIWHKPDGDYAYAQFDVKNIEYNVNVYQGFDSK